MQTHVAFAQCLIACVAHRKDDYQPEDKVCICYTPPMEGKTNRTLPVVALSVMSYRLAQGFAPRPLGVTMPQQEACKTRKPYPVRFSPEELVRIRLLAEAAGMPVSTYIRSRALGSRGRVTASPRAQYLRREYHLADLRRLGGYLGRLFIQSGGEQGPLDRAALAAAMAEIRMAAMRIEQAA
jgi:hypothetical protein